MRTSRLGRLVIRGAVLAALGVVSLGNASPAAADSVDWTRVEQQGAQSVDWTTSPADNGEQHNGEQQRMESLSVDWT
ncbi:hypothetical protein ACFQZ4_53915 [Catellatospora coxensis]|uniref:Uncharacterized protein n=1 Tax=Catellatospora coxensis TaxID=310354 RepID=A0A8J3P6S8_9ACTN|nr:hypothetical protein [Catellatospora coxensis]GIG05854.1 hypothetical protein Cco03nite_25540 [Catellatospora coxensis]